MLKIVLLKFYKMLEFLLRVLGVTIIILLHLTNW